VLDEGLRSLDADIVALEKTLLLDDHDQVTEIVPESMHVVHSENRRPHEMGVSIASHWPIQRVEELVADSDRQTILLGDLDAEPDSASVRFLRGLQSVEGMSVCYQDAWERVHPGQPGEDVVDLAERPVVCADCLQGVPGGVSVAHRCAGRPRRARHVSRIRRRG